MPKIMARCYHCGKVLEDDWLKRQGAALMGKTSGEKKARSSEQARQAALKRWEPDSPPPKPAHKGPKKRVKKT
jgi:hypothetical protein